MKLCCLMPVRNEAWILGLSARAVLEWVDHLVVLDHASTDPTPAILWELAELYPDRITVLNEDDPQWNEMAHRQRLLEECRRQKATHIIYVDADEVLTANLLPRIRGMVECTPPGVIMQLPWLGMRGSIHLYHIEGPWACQDASIAFVDDPRWHWAARDGYDFHQRHPMGLPFKAWKPLARGDGGLMHLQFVGDHRLRAKQALYKMLEVTRWPGREPLDVIDKRYSLAVHGAPKQDMIPGLVGHFGIERAREIIRAAREANPHLKLAGDVIGRPDEPEQLGHAPAEWWAAYTNLMQYLHVDDPAWQAGECQRLWQIHGPAKFAGLDLFGVI